MNWILIVVAIGGTMWVNVAGAADAWTQGAIDRYGRTTGVARGNGDFGYGRVLATNGVVSAIHLSRDASGELAYSSLTLMELTDGRVVGLTFTAAGNGRGGLAESSLFLPDVQGPLTIEAGSSATPKGLRSMSSASYPDIQLDRADVAISPSSYRFRKPTYQEANQHGQIDHAAYSRSIRPVRRP